MSNAVFCENTWYYPCTCCQCGISFALNKDFRERRIADSKLFYCPNGHRNMYSDSELDRLRKRIERTEVNRDHWKNKASRQEKRIATHKGHNTRLKNKIKTNAP